MILIDWLWMFFQFWASLVVVAVVEINGKRKIFGWHWFLIYFANFWAYFIILATAHFDFLRIPGNSNSIRIIFFPWGKSRKLHSNWLSPRIFPNLSFISLFLPYLVISFQKILIGHSGNEWEIFGCHWFLDNSC